MQQEPELFTNIKPFLIEKKIDDSNLDPCGKSILRKLKNTTQNDIAKMISKLGGANTVSNLNISSSNLGNNALGGTYWALDAQNIEIPYNYTIKIHELETAASSNLAIAGTMLHEIVHAFFLSLIDDCEHGDDCSTLISFTDIWNFYFASRNGGIFTNNPTQHHELAENYVDAMASALQEIIANIPPTTPIQQVFKDVAWYGLKGTIPYEALSPEEQQRIEFRFENVELLNQNATNPAGITIVKQGTRTSPCN